MNKLLAAGLLILIALLGVDKYSKQQEAKKEIINNDVVEIPKKEAVLDVAL